MSDFWLRTSYIELFGHEPALRDEDLSVLFAQAGNDVELALELARERDPQATPMRIES